MPRFYFNVRDGDTLIADQEGVEMPGKTAAAEEARQAARDLLAEPYELVRLTRSHQTGATLRKAASPLTTPCGLGAGRQYLLA